MLEQALENGEMFDPERAAQICEQLEDRSQEQLDQLLSRLVQKLVDEGYITTEPQGEARARAIPRSKSVTDKSIDFLGFKTLKDLLGSLGRSSFGAHDMRDMATGVESSGAAKKYEFGDTLNLDIGQTLFSALQRENGKLPLNLEYEGLHGDSLRCVLFHDTAEELRLEEMARVQVGPYYTNTRDGLILAQRLLAQERKDMKQIIMITDGKPSALTLDDRRIYRNAFGLDPLVISRTLEEVSRCKRQGVLINTLMLASDYGLAQFIQKVTELCRGRRASPRRIRSGSIC